MDNNKQQESTVTVSVAIWYQLDHTRDIQLAICSDKNYKKL